MNARISILLETITDCLDRLKQEAENTEDQTDQFFLQNLISNVESEIERYTEDVSI